MSPLMLNSVFTILKQNLALRPTNSLRPSSSPIRFSSLCLSGSSLLSSTPDSPLLSSPLGIQTLSRIIYGALSPSWSLPPVASTSPALPPLISRRYCEHVDNLLASDDTHGAIAYLEHRISRLQSKGERRDLELATTMSDLAKLYKSSGDAFKAQGCLTV